MKYTPVPQKEKKMKNLSRVFSMEDVLKFHMQYVRAMYNRHNISYYRFEYIKYSL